MSDIQSYLHVSYIKKCRKLGRAAKKLKKKIKLPTHLPKEWKEEIDLGEYRAVRYWPDNDIQYTPSIPPYSKTSTELADIDLVCELLEKGWRYTIIFYNQGSVSYRSTIITNRTEILTLTEITELFRTTKTTNSSKQAIVSEYIRLQFVKKYIIVYTRDGKRYSCIPSIKSGLLSDDQVAYQEMCGESWQKFAIKELTEVFKNTVSLINTSADKSELRKRVATFPKKLNSRLTRLLLTKIYGPSIVYTKILMNFHDQLLKEDQASEEIHNSERVRRWLKILDTVKQASEIVLKNKHHTINSVLVNYNDFNDLFKEVSKESKMIMKNDLKNVAERAMIDDRVDIVYENLIKSMFSDYGQNPPSSQQIGLDLLKASSNYKWMITSKGSNKVKAVSEYKPIFVRKVGGEMVVLNEQHLRSNYSANKCLTLASLGYYVFVQISRNHLFYQHIIAAVDMRSVNKNQSYTVAFKLVDSYTSGGPIYFGNYYWKRKKGMKANHKYQFEKYIIDNSIEYDTMYKDEDYSVNIHITGVASIGKYLLLWCQEKNSGRIHTFRWDRIEGRLVLYHSPIEVESFDELDRDTHTLLYIGLTSHEISDVWDGTGTTEVFDKINGKLYILKETNC